MSHGPMVLISMHEMLKVTATTSLKMRRHRQLKVSVFVVLDDRHKKCFFF
jgi:hypothetical protein